MDTGLIVTIAIFTAGLIFGVIAFFLKRAFNQVDRIEKEKASRTELCELKTEVSDLEKTIGEIKTNYLTKEDFFREQAKTDRKLDRIMEVLMDIKGGAAKYDRP